MKESWIMDTNKDLTRYEKAVRKREKRWNVEKPLLETDCAIEAERRYFCKKEKRKISTSKLLIAFLFINCTLIELFTGWAIIKMLAIVATTGAMIDFTPLVTLIGTVISEVIGYAIYALKSAKENSVGGIVYDKAMQESAPIEIDNLPSLPDGNGVG